MSTKIGSIAPVTRYACRYQCPKRENKIGHFETGMYIRHGNQRNLGNSTNPEFCSHSLSIHMIVNASKLRGLWNRPKSVVSRASIYMLFSKWPIIFSLFGHDSYWHKIHMSIRNIIILSPALECVCIDKIRGDDVSWWHLTSMIYLDTDFGLFFPPSEDFPVPPLPFPLPCPCPVAIFRKFQNSEKL